MFKKLKSMSKKHRTVFYGIIAVVFLVGVGFIVNQAPTKPISKFLTATIGGGAGSPSSLDPKLGFNGFFIEQFIRSKNLPANLETLKTVMETTGATWLRFPGGTRANEYVPDMTATGLGRDNTFDKSFSRNFAEDYADYVINIGNTTKTSYVLNMAAHFPDYFGGVNNMAPRLRNKTDDQIIAMNLSVIEYLLNRGVNIAYIEIGNEGYLANLSKNRNLLVKSKSLSQVTTVMKPEMDKYEQLANSYMKALDELAIRKTKELKRTISFKYGIPFSAPQGPARPYMGSYAARNEYWNIRVAQINTDAVVPHLYTALDDCRLQNPDSKRTACMVQKSKDYLVLLPTIIDRTRAVAPGKEIWVTEFNAGLGFSNTDPLSLSSFVNSPEHIQVIKDMIKIFKDKKIENYMFHMLNSTESGYAIIRNLGQTTSALKSPNSTDFAISGSICGLILSPKSSLSCQ